MTGKTYEQIAQLYHTLVDSESDLSKDFQFHAELYWKLESQLPKEQWQIVNNCFCCFQRFYMALLALALHDTP